VRIERVTAHAFGPFSGESLDLAPGLTVVSGPNEAGKSSWHAAIRAGICGVRRGRGAGTKVEAAFEDRHRPWDGDGRWEVEVRLALDDGRTIEISQDLAGKVACRATDVVLGRDVSDEILDGTPDASRWLGLDRDAFAATICVGQAQIAAIASRDTAASLQEHMQRAAATRGTDATAAEARERLDEFRRARVGVDRQGARGPLRAAKERAELARVVLADANARHESFLDASLSAEAAERAAAAQGARAATIEAALAGRAAAEQARRANRAIELTARHRTEPAGIADRDTRADAVVGALDAWIGRPQPEPLSGTTAAELEAELSSIPAPPDGDLEVDASVLEARRALDRAEDALALLPPVPGAPAGPGADELRVAEHEPITGATRRGVGWIAAAALAALAAVVAFVAGQPLAAAAAGILAAGLVAAAWVLRRASAGQDRVERDLVAREAAAWDARRADMEERRAQAATRLSDALRARGVEAGDGSLPAAMVAYEDACRQRAEQARRAGGRVALERELATRREAEAAAAETARSADRAERALRTVAAAVELDADGSPDELAAALGAWRRERSLDSKRADEARREWHELVTLLDGRPLDKMRAESEAAATRAATMASKVDAVALADLASRDDLASLLEVEREELARAREDASTQRGALAEMQRDLPDVAEAEEAFAEASSELTRVVGLATVLTETTRLLRAAEERVHRDLAPILAAAITRWLPRVSGGAYVDASVDPADLSVRVKEAKSGRWRSALLLSEGTREQIYLLLRVAMAQQLATTGETAPLLLDEVTVQADAERKQQLLGVLHELSAERQIILFTHDDDVIGWAARSLAGERDSLVELRAAAHARQAAVG
jgi:DNA repair protein SbcC/Rad50